MTKHNLNSELLSQKTVAFRERSHCISCGSSKLHPLWQGKFTSEPTRSFIEKCYYSEDVIALLKEETFSLISCDICGMVFHQRILTPEWLNYFQNLQIYVPILLKEAVKQKRFDLLLSVLDLCVPPLSLLVVIWLLLMTVSLLFAIFATSWIAAAIVATAGFCFLMAIFIAWAKFARQDLPIHELLTIPFYVFWKIPVYLQFLVKPESMWVRTERDKI